MVQAGYHRLPIGTITAARLQRTGFHPNRTIKLTSPGSVYVVPGTIAPLAIPTVAFCSAIISPSRRDTKHFHRTSACPAAIRTQLRLAVRREFELDFALPPYVRTYVNRCQHGAKSVSLFATVPALFGCFWRSSAATIGWETRRNAGAAGGYRTYDLSLTKGVLYH